jgi:molecular chaperone DnaK
MEEMKDKLSADSKSKLESEIKKVEDALTSNNLDQIKTATESLNKVWNEIASQLYQQTSQQQTTGEQGKGGEEQTKEQKENVQDASYEVVDDDDNKDK